MKGGRVVPALACGLALQGFGPGDVQVTPGAASRIPIPSGPERIRASADEASRMTVPVRINGVGPFPFIIYTGADRTVVSRELADTLKLKPGDPVMMHDIGGVDLNPTAVIATLNVGARELKGIDAPTLKAGDIGAQGILGIDSLRDQRMVMDFRSSGLSVEPSRRWDLDPDVIVVRAKSRFGQLVLVDASYDGRPLQVIIDSGAQNTVGNLALERMAVGGAGGAIHPSGEVVSVSGRTKPARFAMLGRVRIGEATVSNMPIAFADLHTFAQFDMNRGPAMLLGMDVLRQFDQVVVDFRKRKVSFLLPHGA